ncbi:rhodanese-related sulfurtransferase [soil metagenome]
MMPPVPRAHARTEVQTFYHFTTLSKADVLRIDRELIELGKSTGVTALIILGEEGLNATAAGESIPLHKFVHAAAQLLGPGFEFQNIKVSFIEAGEKLPFLDFKVKVRKEIVTLQRPDLVPKERQESGPKDTRTLTHLSPEEWHRQIQNPDAVLIDTRNAYESVIGTFKNAQTPNIEEFAEFPDWLDEKLAKGEADKAKPTYIFCTGGIRCEKAILAMEEKGFEHVYQLDGGILNYITKFPATETAMKPETPEGSMWNGECFVFDHRIAVDGDGRASQKFSACPHCGQAADHQIFCVRCDGPAVLCDDCYNAKAVKNACTCSKNCAHHWAVRPGVKGKPQKFDDLKLKSVLR